MNTTGWFNKYGIHSGEGGYSTSYFHNNEPFLKWRPNHVKNHQPPLKTYVSYGLSGNTYPVFYGLDLGIPLNMKISEQPLSNRGINTDYIKAIYVPPQKKLKMKNNNYLA